MEWFYKPKVQFGIWVNLVFVLFTLASPAPRVRHPDYGDDYSVSPAASPAAVPYAPPPAPPNKVSVVDAGGRINVFLNSDLTLVRKPGHTLVFAPTITFDTSYPDAPPAKVVLRFTIFSQEKEACPGSCLLVVNADGERVVESAAGGASAPEWTHEKVPASTMRLPSGEVAETLASETLSTQISYQKFIDIISARRVVMSLGADRVELTGDQMESLRELYHRLAPPQESGGPKTITF